MAAATTDRPARAALERYVVRLLERNAATNLTAARDAASVMEHVRDALGLAPYVRGPHVDIGSGGGFPAIPLAIATGYPMTLVESVAKKAGFLREIVAELGLRVAVVCARAEEAGRDPGHRECYGSGTARAVGGVTTVLELVVPLLAVGGVALLQRGSLGSHERAATSDAALVLGALWTAEYAVVDGAVSERAPVETAGRRLLVVTKTTPTGPRFPRRAGIPAKRPLCIDAGSGP